MSSVPKPIWKHNKESISLLNRFPSLIGTCVILRMFSCGRVPCNYAMMTVRKGITRDELKERIYERFGIERRLTLLITVNKAPCPDTIEECAVVTFRTLDESKYLISD